MTNPKFAVYTSEQLLHTARKANVNLDSSEPYLNTSGLSILQRILAE